MNAENFLLLKSRWPSLYQFGCSAENYVHSDPQIASIKLRCFVEQIVATIYQDLNLPAGANDTLLEKLNAPAFRAMATQDMLAKFHRIRIGGNSGAHGRPVATDTILALLEEAYLVGQWFFRSYHHEAVDYPVFAVPPISSSIAPAQADDDELRSQVAALRAELERVQTGGPTSRAGTATVLAPVIDEKVRLFAESSREAAKIVESHTYARRFHIRMQDVFGNYALNEGQAELIRRLERFLDDPAAKVFLLKGYAGTGKTFITRGLTEYFRSIGRGYVLAAPTGKAAKVIAVKTASPAYTIHKTIYSFKDIVEYRQDDLDGTETYKFYAELAVNEGSADTVYIVDEASMISDEYQEAEFFRFGSGHLLTDLLKYVNLDHNDHRKKLILIGDDAQLPPIGMNFSPALNADYLLQEHGLETDTFELVEVVRQRAGSGVLANAIPVRQALAQRVFNRLVTDLTYPDVQQIEAADLVERYLASCNGKINGESMIIAYSNSDVAEFNRRVRAHFFPGCEQLVAGDKVIAMANANCNGVFVSNGDFGLVRQVFGATERRSITLKRKLAGSPVLEQIPIELSFRDIEIGFKDIDGTSRFFRVKILEDLLNSKVPNLTSDESKALYLDFCLRHPGLNQKTVEFKLALTADPYFNALRVKYGYAITCHKAQGSEWNNVFLQCRTTMSQLTADYFRWFYTAITRAGLMLYLLDPPQLKPWTGNKLIRNPGSPPFPSPDSEEKMAQNITSTQPDVGSKLEAVSDYLGIPEDIPFLRELLDTVRGLIVGESITVKTVVHNQYQEAYTFASGDESARLYVSYNTRRLITNVTAPQSTMFATRLLGLLAPLKGPLPRRILGTDVVFSKPFLNDYVRMLDEVCDSRGIILAHVEEQSWCLRLSFRRRAELAVFDVWYNGRDQISRSAPVGQLSTSSKLVLELSSIITTGTRV